MNFNLELLRKVTGAFVSRADFEVVLLHYKESMKEHGFEDTPENAQKFCEDWKEEQEMLGTFATTTDGNLKYYVLDGVDDNDEKLTVQELLDQMDGNSFSWETQCRKMWKKTHELVPLISVPIKELLEDETISYEQIYSLDRCMKNRVDELLGD